MRRLQHKGMCLTGACALHSRLHLGYPGAPCLYDPESARGASMVFNLDVLRTDDATGVGTPGPKG